MLPSFCKCIWFIGVHIFLQFWGWDNCCDEKCTLHILYSKAAFSFTPLTISLDRNTSILELWNWSLTKSFALYFEAMHQGSRHLRIQDVPLVHISLGIGNQIHVLWGALPRTQILWGACTQMQLWLHRAPHAPGIQPGRCSDSLGPCTFDGWACPLRGMSLASFLLSFFSGTSILM